jgi:F420-0:gamma-glutamyl ligase
MLEVKAYSTRIFGLGENLIEFIINEMGEEIQEGHILVVTSKIVSLWLNRVIPKHLISKEALIREEADQYLGCTEYGVHLTIKENQLFPSSGIDESNCQGDYWILFPKDPYKVAEKILEEVKTRLKFNRLGIIMTDSKTTPLRRGVTGTALAYAGFQGVINKKGSLDLFDRPLKVTEINQADALASAAVLLMGEGAEGKPLALIKIEVSFKKVSAKEIQIAPKEDLYAPLFHCWPMDGPES